MKKTFFYLFLSLFAFKVNINYAQQAPFAQLVISNCYQSVSTGPNGNYNFRFLSFPKVNGQPSFKIKSTNPLDLYALEIYEPPLNPGDNPLLLGTYDVSNGLDRTVILPEFPLNPREIKRITIKPVYKDEYLWLAIGTIDIEFIDEPEFNIFNATNPTACIPLNQTGAPNNNNSYGFNVNLDGLCDYELKLKYNSGNNTSNPFNGLYDGYERNLSNPSDRLVGIPINTDFCDQNNSNNNQYTQKCINFTLELTIKPCNPGQEGCPELIFSKNVELCCWCE